MRANSSIAALLLGAGLLLAGSSALAQNRQGPPKPTDAQAGAPIDLTGQWVSVVTEDWRWRMVTPAKGDYASVPLNDAGKKQADTWDLAADDSQGEQCRAFGVGGLMRTPMRIRISWADANTLKLDTDAGQQTRLMRFVSPAAGNILPELLAADPAPADRTWQGQSKAQWYKQIQSRGLGFGGFAGQGGALRVMTRNMRAGYLRKNGVPYSADAVVTEQFNRHQEANGDVWLTVTTIVQDPKYLSQPFITSTEFKKEADQAKWSPTPCRTSPPLEAPVTKPPKK